jgi:hypothetical protein
MGLMLGSGVIIGLPGALVFVAYLISNFFVEIIAIIFIVYSGTKVLRTLKSISGITNKRSIQQVS